MSRNCSSLFYFHHSENVCDSSSKFSFSPIIGVQSRQFLPKLFCFTFSRGSFQACCARANLPECTGKIFFALRSFTTFPNSSGKVWMYFHFSLYWPFSKIAQEKGPKVSPIFLKLRFNFRDKKKCSYMLQAGLTNIPVLGD